MRDDLPLGADRVNRDGEDKLIGRQRGVVVGVGGRDGELRPDLQDRDGARRPPGVEDHGRGEGVGGAGQSRAIEDVARPVQDDAVGDSVAVEIGQKRRIGQTDAAPAATGSKVPLPLPSSTPIALSWLLTVTRSGRPSPLTSATTVWTGERSVAKVCWLPKVPSPLFSRTLTLLLP